MQTYSIEHPSYIYAQDIVDKRLISCEFERLACLRHLQDLEKSQKEDYPYIFDETRANRIYDWFERCCYHVRGVYSGQLIKLLDWQKFDLGVKYGWVCKDSGRRRFKKAYNKRARGNVKSTEMSGLALYGMCSDVLYKPYKPQVKVYEIMPEVACAAVDKEQAKRVWSDACEMGKKSPDIAKRLRIKRTYVEHTTRGGEMKPLSKDTKNKDGGAPCLVIIDEYHAHQTSEIHDVCYSGFGKRSQSLMEIITTAGKNAENSPCLKEEDYAKRILKGEVEDDSYFVMIRELDKDDNPHNERVWIKANPILQSDNEYSQLLFEQIQNEHNAAYGSNDPSKIREFLTKRCNLWQSGDENRYFDGCMDDWKALAVSKAEFNELIADKPQYIGLDLSKTTDLTAFASVCWLEDGRLAVTAHGYMPSESADRHERSDRIPYKYWAKQGFCTLTDGAVTDYNFVKQDIDRISEKYGVEEIGYDPYNATHLAQQMDSEGYLMVEIRQGIMNLTETTKRFRELVLQGKIVHDGNPLLTWCISNAVEINDNNGNIRISKKHKDDTQRVDLLTAVINACVRAMLLHDDSGGFFIG